MIDVDFTAPERCHFAEEAKPLMVVVVGGTIDPIFSAKSESPTSTPENSAIDPLPNETRRRRSDNAGWG